MAKSSKIVIEVSEPTETGEVYAKVGHLYAPVCCGPILDGKKEEKTSARDHAVQTMKAVILEADARWVRSGGMALEAIESRFEIKEGLTAAEAQERLIPYKSEMAKMKDRVEVLERLLRRALGDEPSEEEREEMYKEAGL